MGKLDQYCFDGTNALSLKKLPTDSKKDQVDKEKILAKTEKNQEKIFVIGHKNPDTDSISLPHIQYCHCDLPLHLMHQPAASWQQYTKTHQQDSRHPHPSFSRFCFSLFLFCSSFFQPVKPDADP